MNFTDAPLGTLCEAVLSKVQRVERENAELARRNRDLQTRLRDALDKVAELTSGIATRDTMIDELRQMTGGAKSRRGGL